MADNLAGMMASGGAAAPGGAAFPPISNYKGVMLCDRPSADIGPAKPAPFNSAVVPPVQLGLNPPKKVSVYSTENKKKDTDSVLYKHKQYLAHLQKDIKAQKEAEAGMAQESDEKRKQFVERSAQLRDAIRAGLLATGEVAADEPEAAAAEDGADAPSPPADVEPEAPPKESVVIPPLNLAAAKEGEGQELLGKPKWALTEEQAEEQDELQEEVDLDELLDFVEDLDFEEYVDDLEVRQALEIMKSRIASIDTYRSETERRDAAANGEGEAVVVRPDDGAEGELVDKEEGWDGLAADEEEKLHSDEAMEAARKVLDSSRKLRQVHSTKSMATKLEALREQAEAAEAAIEQEEETKEIDPSNLPYLHRNPAV